MIHHVPRRGQNSRQEWLSAIFTLLVLTGIYSSMDRFSSYGTSPVALAERTETTGTSSVAPPYWNHDLRYGFRSVAWDSYTASGSGKTNNVIVKPTKDSLSPHADISVSYYKDTSIDQIDRSLIPGSPRAYSRLPHGIAVIQWDLESPSAKTIFSTLYSD
jgi:hypothetical protein